VPELPEVETIRRTLAPELAGAAVRRVDVRARDVVGRPDARTFAARLAGARFTGVGRRGKYLLLALEPGSRDAGGDAAEGGGAQPGRRPAPLVLVVHLRMTGRLVLAGPDDPEPPHTHVVFHLDGGRLLRYADVRRFGRLYLFEAAELPPSVLEPAGLAVAASGGAAASGGGAASGGAAASGPAGRAARAQGKGHRSAGALPPAGARTAPGDPPGLFSLGPEPADPRFDARWLRARCRGRRAPIKALLLDQRVVAGLGNIYVDEALFAAGIHPARPAGDLAPGEIRRLVEAVRSVVDRAVQRRGTTLSDFVDGYGRPGEMRPHLAVYGRDGEPCPRCGTPVEKIRVAGRGTHLCPRCQAVPAQGARSPAVLE